MNIRILVPFYMQIFNLLSIFFRSIIFAKEIIHKYLEFSSRFRKFWILLTISVKNQDVIDQSGNVNSICFTRSVNALKVVPVIPIGQGLD